jgi:DNA replication protein DnaC
METPPLLELHLRQLKLTGMLQHYQQMARESARADHSYLDFLAAVAAQEVTLREQRRHRRNLSGAHFPVLKDLATFDFTALERPSRERLLDLAQGHYIAKTESIILVGHPGVGKTHLATALGVAACRQGHRVRFWNAAGLVNELIQAQDEHRLARFQASLLRYQVVILDEVGFIPFSTLGSQLLFQVCSALYERVAVIVTTNLRFADWTQVFGQESLTAALLDRLTHRSHILDVVGQSYRLRQRQQAALGTGKADDGTAAMAPVVPMHAARARPSTDEPFTNLSDCDCDPNPDSSEDSHAVE